jgi:nucleotide-binding universal stress UspA family protein
MLCTSYKEISTGGCARRLYVEEVIMARGPIVVGVDGSQSSLDALRFAAKEAAKERAEDGLDLVVVHVRRLPWAMTSETVAPVSQAADLIARETEEAVKQLLEGSTVTWRWFLREGDPARELVRVAEEQQARAIAVGGHKHGALTAALVRSVDSSLVHLYCGTLFIVRPDVREPAEPALPV